MTLVTLLDEELFKAIQKDSINHFFRILGSKIEKNSDKDELHYLINTSLLYIAAEGATKCLTSLLHHCKFQHYVDVNTKDDDGDTPLNLSIKQGHVEIALILLEDGGVDITNRNNHGETALDLVCQHKVAPLLAPLTESSKINRFMNVSKISQIFRQYQYTALIQSIESRFVDGTSFLLKNGFDVNVYFSNHKGSPLHYAIENDSVECVDLILSYNADIEALNDDHLQQTPLMLATQNGLKHIVETLLAKGVKIDRQTEECSTALTLACHFGFQDIAFCLLDNGADPSIVNSWGFTALYMSVDSPSILSRILQHPNVDVNQRCGERLEAPLHLAAVIGCTNAFNQILNAGADINALTEFEETPLWLAVWKHHTELAIRCIQVNCKLNIPSNGCEVYKCKYTPLELALGGEQFEVAYLLHYAGAEEKNRVYCHSEKEPNSEHFPSWVKLRSEVLGGVYRNKAMYAWFHQAVQNPRTLVNCSLIAVRKFIGKSTFLDKVNNLALPQKLTMLVTLQHYQHYHH